MSLEHYTRTAFSISESAKLAVDIVNSPSFYGFNPFATVFTQGRPDLREHYDFGDDTESTWEPGQPLWKRMRPGRNQYPEDEKLPKEEFKKTLLQYLEHMRKLAKEFSRVLAISLGLPQDAFDNLDGGGRIKLCRYPAIAELDEETKEKWTVKEESDGSSEVLLGVGEHRDAWLTFTLGFGEASNEINSTATTSGLQIRLSRDDPYTTVSDLPPNCTDKSPLIVNFGHLFTRLTHGAVRATLHRVVLGQRERFSVPYFADVPFDASLSVGWHVATKSVGPLQSGGKEASDHSSATALPPPPPPPPAPQIHIGESYLINRCRSHPRVGWKWYPELMEWLRVNGQLST